MAGRGGAVMDWPKLDAIMKKPPTIMQKAETKTILSHCRNSLTFVRRKDL